MIGLLDVSFRQVPSGGKLPAHGQKPREVRDHLLAIHPQLIAFVAYVDDAYADDVKRELAAAKTARERETVFAPFLTRNPYYCGLYDDPRFAASFRFVDIIRRKDTYWFVLFERA